MRLSTIFAQLSHGELANVAVGGFDAGGIPTDKVPMIIDHINLGLLEIHKRVAIKTNTALILLDPNITQYVLHSDHAQSNTTSSQPKYIEDTSRPKFMDDVVKIDRVFNAVNGKPLGLNDSHDYYSCHTLNENTVQVPADYPWNNILVTYRATIPDIPVDADLETYEVDLPSTYLLSLLYFVAARVFANHIDGSLKQNTGNNYMTKFEGSIAQIKQNNLVSTVNVQSDKFHKKGWV